VQEAGGTGDISLRFYDTEGRPIQSALDERVLGMTLRELAQVDRVIALAGGKFKTRAIHGALKSKVINLLITDKFTAQRLITDSIEYN
jgi:DNA-binding transcriptional regulator LsrR (DeoR family)